MPRPSQYFHVVKRSDGLFRLVHKPSGDYIQRHLCDFLMYRDAIACRNALIAAAPEWDWSDIGLFSNMPAQTFDKAWGSIYGNR